MRSLLALLLLLMAAPVAAQTVTADRFQLKTGPCTLRSGSGSPEGAVAGQVCDTFWRTDTGQIYTKTSGTGNTGWTLPGGVSGSGTTNSLAKWTATTTIGNAAITDDGATVTVMPTGNVLFANGGDVIFNPTGNDLLPTTGYDLNIGALTNKFLSLHAAELWVETLVAQNTMATIGGRILVAPTTLLTVDLAPAGTTMTVKHNDLANGDRIYMEANGKLEFMNVTSNAGGSAGAYTYSIQRNQDGGTADQWYAGDAILNTGTTGDGYIDLYSVSGVIAGSTAGPTIVGNVRTGTAFNAISPRWAIGNLNGLYGYSSSVFGSVFGTPSGARITIDATDGIRIYGGDNDEKVTIDTSGNATFDGSITVGVGTNQVRNSECRASTDEWAVSYTTAVPPTLAFGLSPWRLMDQVNTCYLVVAGTPGNDTVTNAIGPFVPAQAGMRYEASVYVGLHRGKRVDLALQFTDATPTLTGLGSASCTSCGSGGTTLSSFTRLGTVATAPTGTTQMRLILQAVYDGAQADPHFFWVRSYLGEAKLTQEDISEWTPAGLTEIVGGIIQTDAINARTITADAITTSELAADSVTSAKIVAGTIVASDIAANTLTANEIAANAITTSELNADSVTSAKIAAGTIDATDISAGSITADRLNVTTLSAISANMGTITAGTITGGTIDGAVMRAGSGDEITLDASGMSIGSGSGTGNKIKWGNSQEIFGMTDGDLWVQALSGSLQLVASSGAGGTNVSGGLSVANGITMGTGTLKLTPLTGGTSFLCLDGSDNVYANGSTCDGSVPALQQQIDLLKQELAALRAELAALRSPQRDHE